MERLLTSSPELPIELAKPSALLLEMQVNGLISKPRMPEERSEMLLIKLQNGLVSRLKMSIRV